MAKSLRITDFSDRELLAIVADADKGGGATTQEIAALIWPSAADPDSDEAFHARAVVSSRMSWMRRFGLVNRNGREWELSLAGAELLAAKVSTSINQFLHGTGEYTLVAVLAGIGERYASADDAAATALRREWTYGQARRHR